MKKFWRWFWHSGEQPGELLWRLVTKRRFGPYVGELVCTCRMVHEKIVDVAANGDTVTMTSGWRCSYYHCCHPVDHEWSHDSVRPAALD